MFKQVDYLAAILLEGFNYWKFEVK